MKLNETITQILQMMVSQKTPGFRKEDSLLSALHQENVVQLKVCNTRLKTSPPPSDNLNIDQEENGKVCIAKSYKIEDYHK
jgi:hypothetical protein